MSSLSRDLVFMILQYLDEGKFKESLHAFEQESGYFFNLKYFEEKFLLGEWDEVEKYLSGFIKVSDHPHSTKIIFEIRRQKYYEALDRDERAKALEIVAKELKVFSSVDEKVYKELTMLLTEENFRENQLLSPYSELSDIKSARSRVVEYLRILIEGHPLLRHKLVMPTIEASRLPILLSQSLNWQHLQCENERPDPDMNTLFTDHTCSPQNGTQAPGPVLPVAAGRAPYAIPNPSSSVPRVAMRKRPRQPSLPRRFLYAPAGDAVIPLSRVMEIVDPAQCPQVTMPDSKDSISKVARLLYTNSGGGILALGTNGLQRLWKWSPSVQNPTGKATASVTPEQLNSGFLMVNDVPENPEGTVVPCIALFKDDSHALSACGGNVSFFDLITFKVVATYMTPPPASTFMAIRPRDNNTVAIGMDNSTINIYQVAAGAMGLAELTLRGGHQKHITGLAFSDALNILVSSGADGQLCFWSTHLWEQKKTLAIQRPAGMSPVGDTRVQFHNDQVRLLVSHETQIAIYDASKMECIQKWEPQDSISSPITCASYSCDSQLVYVSFADGNIGVFDAEYLRLRCRIAPSAYMPQPTPNRGPIMPLVITTHPQVPNQIAVGLSDGTVIVLETPDRSLFSCRESRDNGRNMTVKR